MHGWPNIIWDTVLYTFQWPGISWMVIDMKDDQQVLLKNLKQACKRLFLIRSLIDHKRNELFFLRFYFFSFFSPKPPVHSCIFFVVGPCCGMWDAASAWFDEQCHVHTQDSNQRNTGPPAAEHANLTSRPRGQAQAACFLNGLTWPSAPGQEAQGRRKEGREAGRQTGSHLGGLVIKNSIREVWKHKLLGHFASIFSI